MKGKLSDSSRKKHAEQVRDVEKTLEEKICKIIDDRGPESTIAETYEVYNGSNTNRRGHTEQHDGALSVMMG